MLPPIDSSLLPADVRAAGPKGRELYAAALGFEQQLETQLTQQLADSAQPQDDGSDDSGDDSGTDDSGDAGTSMYTSMLPDAMAQGLTASGGLGLADELFRVLNLGSSAPAAPASGGDASGTGTPPAVGAS